MKWKTILSERTILIFLILIILAVGGLILYVTFLLAYKLKWWGAVGVIIYFIILDVFYSLTKRYNFRYLQIIEKIFLFPFFILSPLFDLLYFLNLNCHPLVNIIQLIYFPKKKKYL